MRASTTPGPATLSVAPISFGESGSDSVRFKRTCAACPTSARRVLWDFLGMFFIGYDVIMIPMQAFPLETSAFLRVMDVGVLLFWTCDIWNSFTVGYFYRGEIVLDMKSIALRYLRTWFIPDVAVVSSDWLYNVMDWQDTGSDQTQVGSLGRSLRALRVVRTIRLLRLLKLQRILARLQNYIESDYLCIIVDVFKFTMLMLLFAHVVACLFYYVGEWQLQGNRSSWIAFISVEEGSLVSFLYVAAYQWALSTLFHESIDLVAQSTVERGLTILINLMGLFIVSIFTSRITTEMVKLSRWNESVDKQLAMFRKFCVQRGVPKALSMRIQRFIEHTCDERSRMLHEDNLPILNRVTESLRGELRYAVFNAHVCTYHVFLHINILSPATLYRLAVHAIDFMSAAAGDTVFAEGDVSTNMYFFVSGRLEYCVRPNSSNGEAPAISIQKGDWLCEYTLWTNWVNKGVLTAAHASETVVVSPNEFSAIVRLTFPVAKVASDYAKGVARWLNSLDPSSLSDLVPVDKQTAVFEEWIEHGVPDVRPPPPSHFRASRAMTGMWRAGSNVNLTGRY